MTTNQVMALFGVSYMTVYNWRTFKGRGARKTIPCHKEPRGSREGVFFLKSEVVAWAASAGVKTDSPEIKELLDARVQRRPITDVLPARAP